MEESELKQSWRTIVSVLLVAGAVSLGFVFLSWAIQMGVSRDVRSALTPCMTMEEARAVLPTNVETETGSPFITNRYDRDIEVATWFINRSKSGSPIRPNYVFVLTFEDDQLAMLTEKRDIDMDDGFTVVFKLDCGGD